MLKIDKFPQAQYDAHSRFGYLAHYYPFSAAHGGNLSYENWRNCSYSPEILNYKEGREADIHRFVDPFLILIRHAIAESNFDTAFLVPVPSSMAATDPLFSKVHREKAKKGSRNRDDRDSVFCDMLANADNELIVADILVRTVTKLEKEPWSAEQHRQSFDLSRKSSLPSGRIALVTIDDVKTNGDTLLGVRMILEKFYPKAVVIGLTIGCTRAPHLFVPL